MRANGATAEVGETRRTGGGILRDLGRPGTTQTRYNRRTHGHRHRHRDRRSNRRACTRWPAQNAATAAATSTTSTTRRPIVINGFVLSGSTTASVWRTDGRTANRRTTRPAAPVAAATPHVMGCAVF